MLKTFNNCLISSTTHHFKKLKKSDAVFVTGIDLMPIFAKCLGI